MNTILVPTGRRSKWLVFLALIGCALFLPTVTASGPGAQSTSEASGKRAPFAVYPGFERVDPMTTSTVLLPSKRYGLSIHALRNAYALAPLDPSATAQTAPNQVGVGRRLDLVSGELGSKYANPDGSKLRVISIVSPGATALRLHFEDFNVAEGDEVYIYGLAGDSHVAGPYSGRGPFGTGDFWTDAVDGDTAVVEHYVRHHETVFHISEMSHIYDSISPDGVSAQVLACEVDANCSPQNEMIAVGRMLFQSGGSAFVCTGTLLNDNPGDFAPLFITAAHCISTDTEAQTLQVFWLYRTSACNSNTLAAGVASSPGAKLLGTSHTADSTLLQITGALPPGIGFSGWNAAAVAGQTAVYGLHHPGGGIPPSLTSFLRASAGTVDPSPADCPAAGLVGGALVNWTTGETEPGSSGSGLFLANHGGLVGTLSCGPSNVTCTSNLSLYSRLSDFYPVIHSYLELGLGALNCVDFFSADRQSFTAAGGSGTVTVSAGAACNWQATSTANWIVISSGSGPGPKQVGFTVLQNSGPARDGSITIQNQTLAIHQDGTAACTIGLGTPSQASFGSAGGAGIVAVTAASNCAWSPSSDAAWLTITSLAGAGNGTVSFSVAANTTTSARSGHVTVGDQSVTISQSVGPVINGAVMVGKQLNISGVNFVDGTSLLIDGAKYKKAAVDPANPTTSIIAKKAANNIARGQLVQLQAQTPDGQISGQFPYRRP